ncbi:hypothetical protein A4A49_56668 [Nicotiana attenuata]|uniref:Uncharacterized protein n=1 Tax=Nicotiana attenuata TaxID=49451 RepID=A0A1J6ITE2_NICAT|nr:hypothetical protein A4A49_56668 [Nicotiana attenuata]
MLLLPHSVICKSQTSPPPRAEISCFHRPLHTPPFPKPTEIFFTSNLGSHNLQPIALLLRPTTPPPIGSSSPKPNQ